MTEKTLDVYRDWLKIQATNRPLNYYQILKLKAFEDNPAVIRKHYRELNAYIRKFATGDYIEESQNLLNEFAKAMLCLTDRERKADYDYKLGRKTEESAEDGKRTFDDILLQNKILTPEQLKKAKNYADAVGLDLQMAILQQRLAPAESVMLAYAESEGLPFINLDDVPVDEVYAPQIEPNTARQHSFVPVMADMGRLILASPAPVSLDVEEELRVMFDMPVRCAICIPTQVNAAIAKFYPRDAVRQAPVRSAGSGGEKTAKKRGSEKTSSEKRVKKARGPLSAEAKKNRLKITVVTFNFTFMATAFARYFTVKSPTISEMVVPALVVGVIGAAVGWFIGSRVGGGDEDDDE